MLAVVLAPDGQRLGYQRVLVLELGYVKAHIPTRVFRSRHCRLDDGLVEPMDDECQSIRYTLR